MSLFSGPNRLKVPTFEQTLDVLRDIPAFLFRALEFGTERNKTFFKELSQGEMPRPHVREMLVRDQAKRFLERHHFQVDDESIAVANEPLSALVLRCGVIQVRVLKGPSGVVPGCGESFRRRRFYNQCPELYRDKDGKTKQTKMNLLCLWDFDKAFNLAGLFLAYPMRAAERAEDVVKHWHEPLIHPVMNAAAHQAEKTQAEYDRAEQELEDLLSQDTLGNLEEAEQA